MKRHLFWLGKAQSSVLVKAEPLIKNVVRVSLLECSVIY